MALSIVPVTPDLWTAFEDLFGKQGACYGCWCTYFRLPPSARKASNGTANKSIIHKRIQAGPPPGLLAFDDTLATGWIQVGPRSDVPEWNNKGRASAPLTPSDAADAGAWAISCFFIRAQARRQGLTHRLVAGSTDYARANGARFVEACPMDLSRDSRSVGLYVGSTRVFEKAGFERVAARKPGRPLMRLYL